MWLLPLIIVALSIVLCYPLGLLMARLLDRPAANTVERWLDTGPQDWKTYCFSMLAFNVAAFVIGFAVLAYQNEKSPLNPDGKTELAPSTIFNTASSFLTNTNLQHYSGEQHLSYLSTLLFIIWKNFITPAIGLAALLAVIRALRGDRDLGNFYLDTWRGTIYILVPLSFIVAVLLIAGGVPMTLDPAA